jgi:hypothetical protein
MSGVYFSTSGITANASAFFEWSKTKLGGSKLGVELTLTDAEAALEEANNEYSMLVNTYQIKNYWSNLLGADKNIDLTSKVQRTDLSFLRRLADAFADETTVGGASDLEIGYLSWTGGNQSQQLFDTSTGGYICNVYDKTGTLIDANSIKIFEVYYYQQKNNAGFYYDPFYLIRSEFGDYSVAVNGGMAYNYIYPLWADIANSQYLKTMANFRRSNYSYIYSGRRLTLYPSPKADFKLWFKFKRGHSLLDDMDPSTTGVSSLADAPFTNLNYQLLNELSQAWVRKYGLTIMKEILGRIRSKYDTVPIPNGTITLDGKALLSESDAEKKELIGYLTKQLEDMSFSKTMEDDGRVAKSVNDQLKYVPLKLYRK